MECRDLSGFARVWNRCTDKYLEIPGLKQEHKILIKEPGTFLGSFEKDISDRAMEMYLIKWIWRSRNLERNWRRG